MAAQDKAEALIEKIGQALDNLVTLQIQTAVTSLQIDQPQGGPWQLAPKLDSAVEGVVTTIDLLQGDVKNAVSGGALQNAQVMSLHADQVKLSRDIVAGNLKELLDLAKSLSR